MSEAISSNRVTVFSPATRLACNLALATVLCLAVFAALLRYWVAPVFTDPKPETVTAAYEVLQPTVTAKGDVESAENSLIVCKVRSRGRGVFSSSIRWIVDDGSRVLKGQTLVELDDSDLEEELALRRTYLEQAHSAWLQAEENYKILRTQNQGDVESARRQLEIDTIDLAKYKEGDYHKNRMELENKLLLAESDFMSWQERRDWTEYMVRRGFLNGLQGRAEDMRLQGARLDRDMARQQLELLESYTKNRTTVGLELRLAESKRRVLRVESQARSREVQANADRLSKKRVHQKRLQRLRDIEEEIAKCTIVSPQDGLVQYCISDQNRGGAGSQMAIVAQGQPVREGQQLMRIPNLAKMQIRTLIHEAHVSQVHGDVYQQTGFTDALQAALSINRDLGSLLVIQDFASNIRKEFHEQDRVLALPGEPVEIYLEAYPDDVFSGHVKVVSESPSYQDGGLGANVVYQVLIAIDEPIEGLRPDLSAQVKIALPESSQPVLVLPLGAVLHSPGDGRRCTCFVMTSQGPREREIEVGRHTDEVVEVLSGLRAGDEVVLHPETFAAPKE